MNLINDPWFSVHRRNKDDFIAPWQLTADYKNNPVVSLNAPRPDFNNGLIQLLIGLIQTTMPPDDIVEWKELFLNPPTPTDLKTAFSEVEEAFNLDGKWPLFMQDNELLDEQKPKPVRALMIDSMGENGTHFVKPIQNQGFCPACAATALFTLQTNAPTGGVGHLTSLRGGGPLTTLLMCSPADRQKTPTLWQTVWLNILPKEVIEQRLVDDSKTELKYIFPWLDDTPIDAKKGRDIALAQVHPLQMYWGMPRRIRLDFDNTTAGECAICGKHDTLITHYRTKNYGLNYKGEWRHVLSPNQYRQVEIKKEKHWLWLPQHPQGQIHYRDWLGFLVQDDDKKRRADVVNAFITEKHHKLQSEYDLRLWAFGYDMDNMKPRCYYESFMPIYYLETEPLRHRFEGAVEKLISAADQMRSNLAACLKQAWFGEGDPRRKGHNSVNDNINNAFWQNTEAKFYAKFYDLLDRLHKSNEKEDNRQDIYQQWHKFLCDYTITEFDRWANCNQIVQQNPRRIAKARQKLKQFNVKKDIKKLLELPD